MWEMQIYLLVLYLGAGASSGEDKSVEIEYDTNKN